MKLRYLIMLALVAFFVWGHLTTPVEKPKATVYCEKLTNDEARYNCEHDSAFRPQYNN